MTSAVSWIKVDETAKEALLRILTERPFLVLPPPLHRLPFRVGNIIEIVGPSPSAKTLILSQAAINCILPKEWKGVQYGGLERAVMFIDLDCRFDVSSFSKALERRIIEDNGLRSSAKGNENRYDRDLFVACMKRFLYIRCYNSFEFLATLKEMVRCHDIRICRSVVTKNEASGVKVEAILQTLHSRLQNEKEKQGSSVYLLMIDSIGAFYWMDRALPSSSTVNNRKSLSLQTVVGAAVQEIQRVLQAHPMLVLATKSAAFGDKQSTEMIRKKSDVKVFDSRGPQTLPYRDFMPAVWQSLVSHRILLRASDGERMLQNRPTFFTEWLLPPLKFSDHFTVDNDGLLVTL